MSIAVVAGLGNPGPAYADTRHNIGFRVVEAVARRWSAGPWRRDGDCDVASVGPPSSVTLVRPMSYMNRSGGALAPLLERFGVSPAAMLVVVDDLDLPLGRLRLRRSGGAGTHNGLRDLVEHLGTGFPRLRVGIAGAGEPPDLAAWVTSPFDDSEIAPAERAVRRAADAIACAVEQGVTEAMNRFNRASETDDVPDPG